MYPLIESLASVTHSRDREQLDVGIIDVLAQYLSAQSIRFFRVLPHGNQRMVHCQVEALRGEPARNIPMTTVASQLPPLELFGWARRWFDGTSVAPIEFAQPGRCCYQFPINDGVEFAGWIEIETRGPMTPHVRRLVGGLLRILANHIQLLDYAERDSLTGLPNRKTFDNSFRRGLSGAGVQEATRGDPSRWPDELPANWLAVVDIDFFKRVNDRFGHLYGDEVLVLLARCMRESFRLSDRLFRFGGEEFAILLEDASPKDVFGLLDRFRERVQALQIPQIGQITVSIGHTRLNAHDTPAAAFDRADAALFHAKQTGRNRVCCWDDLQRSGAVKPLETTSAVELF